MEQGPEEGERGPQGNNLGQGSCAGQKKIPTQDFSAMHMSSSVGFCKMKIGISLENYGSFIHAVQVAPHFSRKVCLLE